MCHLPIHCFSAPELPSNICYAMNKGWTSWKQFFTVSMKFSFLSRGHWKDLAGGRGSPVRAFAESVRAVSVRTQDCPLPQTRTRWMCDPPPPQFQPSLVTICCFLLDIEQCSPGPHSHLHFLSTLTPQPVSRGLPAVLQPC